MELDEQIAKTFKTTSAVSEAEGDECHAASGAHLRDLLRGNHRYVFTLVHKFQTPELLCDRSDVIVLTDEAHRSQYDTLALNMRAALPKAMFLAFTGTPLIAGEESTREVFGDYVSIYDFQQSIEDGATVPLFYENRTPELQLVNPALNEGIYRLSEMTPEQARRDLRMAELKQRLDLLTSTDMAVIVSPGQNEIQQMQTLGLDIEPQADERIAAGAGREVQGHRRPATPRLLRPWATGQHALPRRQARPVGAGIRQPGRLPDYAGRGYSCQAELESARLLAGDGADQRPTRRIHNRP